MSLRERPSGKLPAGPTGPERTCAQLSLVVRMAVERPEGLAGEPWASHLKTCAVCRDEAAGHARSLAVYRAIEGHSLVNQTSALSWESFLGVLERQQAAEERARSRAWWGIPLAAAAAGVLAVGGVLSWQSFQQDSAAPARIVRVQPHEQRTMEDLVRWTLDPDGRGSDPLVSEGDAPDRPGEFGFEWRQMASGDARELAASVAPQEESAVPASAERLGPVTGRGPIPGKGIKQPLPPTMPASNRSGRGLPLFRLEHSAFPTQTVSFSAND